MMLYVFIDESGDTGKPKQEGSSASFCMSVCICSDKDIEKLSLKILALVAHIGKKEIKYSKLSRDHKIYVIKEIEKLKIKSYCVYSSKNGVYLNSLLKDTFQDLVQKLAQHKEEKVKFIIDGEENSFYRKIYTDVISMYFKKYTLKFANSRKTPLLQVADMYAGMRRSFFDLVESKKEAESGELLRGDLDVISKVFIKKLSK